MLYLVPSAAPRLLPLLLAAAPHKLRDRRAHCLWLRGAAAVTEGAHGGGLREGLLAGMLDHLLAVDVEVRCAL